jgi:hypothetical protein
MGSRQQVRAQDVQVSRAAPQAATTPLPPATPGPGGLAGPGGLLGGPGASVDLSKYTVRQLRQMLSEYRDQRQQFASRREGISGNYENASGANREGIGERLRVLDGNIITLEGEIMRVGREIAARGGGSTTEPPPGIPSNYMPEDEAAGMAFGFSFATLVLTLFFMRRYFRRKYAGAPAFGRQQQPNLTASNERLERIEQAVDSIAIEVERVSENQRFMTRLMTETQLGDTIKDVRKSAELAKSAASEGTRD